MLIHECNVGQASVAWWQLCQVPDGVVAPYTLGSMHVIHMSSGSDSALLQAFWRSSPKRESLRDV